MIPLSVSPLRNLPIRHELYAQRTSPQSAQRSTCPPSTGVRHASTAAITRRSVLPRWSAWACRYAGPWRRKMSATSSSGRIGAAQAGAGTAMASEAGCRNSNGLAVAHTLLVARRR